MQTHPLTGSAPPPVAKVPKTFGLRPAYKTAINVLARRRGHDNASEIVRELIDQEMRRLDGRHWEREIGEIAATEGVAS